MRVKGPSMSDGRHHDTAERWLSIIGIGEDGAAGLSAVARGLIDSAELVVGGKRHLALAEAHIRGRALAWPSPITDGIAEIMRHRGRPPGVLASGATIHNGIGQQLAAAGRCRMWRSSPCMAGHSKLLSGICIRARAFSRYPGTRRRRGGSRSCWRRGGWADRG